MIDLTGANLVAYLQRLIRPIVEKNPRFRNALGDVTIPAMSNPTTALRWKDLQVIVKTVTTSGNRLSFDYYMCTQRGRAILCKVADKDGLFVEWTKEVDPTQKTPQAGVYYMNIDYVSEETRDIGLTVQKYIWVEVKGQGEAMGSVVTFRPNIVDPTPVTLTANITGTSIKGSVASPPQAGILTVLATNNFQAGMKVTLDGAVEPFLNGQTVTILNASPSQFTANFLGPNYTNLSNDTGTAVTQVSQLVDLNTLIATDPSTGLAVAFNAMNSSFGGTITLINPCTQLWLTFSNGTALNPNTDYWYERPVTELICKSTVGGQEVLGISGQYVTVTFTDQNGYQLRPGIDFRFYGSPQYIQLASQSPPGSTITANMIAKLNPYTTPPVNPENIINIGMLPSQSLAPNQVFIHTTQGNFTDPTVNSDGTITLPVLLQPGDTYRYDIRIDAGTFKAIAKKWEINSLVIVDPMTIEWAKPDPNQEGKWSPVSAEWVADADPSSLVGVVQTSAGKPLLDQNGNRAYVFPGLWLAFGDIAVVGDQSAIIISPSLTETYQVYGSKENLTFTLEIKSNDLQTSSDLAEMIKQHLLITSRKNVEADGLTIFEATRDYVGEARDASGTASNYIYNVTVTASADWKVYKPLVTRLVSFEIVNKPTVGSWGGNLQATPRVEAFGATMFIPSYV